MMNQMKYGDLLKISKGFNKLFLCLSNTNVKRYLGDSVLNSFVIHPTDENEIQKIIDIQKQEKEVDLTV